MKVKENYNRRFYCPNIIINVLASHLHGVVGLDLLVDLGQHLLHSLLVGLDVLHLPLQAVLHLILHKVDANPRLSVLDTLVVDPDI